MERQGAVYNDPLQPSEKAKARANPAFWLSYVHAYSVRACMGTGGCPKLSDDQPQTQSLATIRAGATVSLSKGMKKSSSFQNHSDC